MAILTGGAASAAVTPKVISAVKAADKKRRPRARLFATEQSSRVNESAGYYQSVLSHPSQFRVGVIIQPGADSVDYLVIELSFLEDQMLFAVDKDKHAVLAGDFIDDCLIAFMFHERIFGALQHQNRRLGYLLGAVVVFIHEILKLQQ